MSSGSLTPNSTTQSTSTPANVAPKKKVTPKKTTPSASNRKVSGGSRAFTSSMQEKQARNKNPYSSSDESDPDTWGSKGHHGSGAYKDTWEQIQKRREAAVILDNPELLMMHAQARFDSITGTRHYFTKLLCGYLDDEEPYSQTEAEEKHQAARRERQERAKSKDYELLQRRWLHAANEEGGENDDDNDNDDDDEMDEDMFDLL